MCVKNGGEMKEIAELSQGIGAACTGIAALVAAVQLPRKGKKRKNNPLPGSTRHPARELPLRLFYQEHEPKNIYHRSRGHRARSTRPRRGPARTHSATRWLRCRHLRSRDALRRHQTDREEAVTIHYLSIGEVATRLNIAQGTASSYLRKGLMPPPDATVGKASGWLPKTIDQWNRERPGRGARTDLRR